MSRAKQEEKKLKRHVKGTTAMEFMFQCAVPIHVLLIYLDFHAMPTNAC